MQKQNVVKTHWCDIVCLSRISSIWLMQQCCRSLSVNTKPEGKVHRSVFTFGLTSPQRRIALKPLYVSLMNSKAYFPV